MDREHLFTSLKRQILQTPAYCSVPHRRYEKRRRRWRRMLAAGLPIVATAHIRSEMLMRGYSSVLWIFARCIPSGNVSSAAYSKLCRDLLA